MNDKKIKMLFVMPHMGLGGAARALVTLLNSLDYEKYEVDLLLYHGKGFNLKFLPQEVNIIGPIMEGNEYFKPLGVLLKEQLKKKRFGTIIRRLYYTAIYKMHLASNKYCNWCFFKKYLPDCEKEYDIAVGYLDGTPHYYVIDKVHAQKKICWVHYDYSSGMYDTKNDIVYLKQADAVATISPKCVVAINKRFPSLNNVKLVYNLNSPKLIYKMAAEPVEYDSPIPAKTLKILSVGRLCEAKAYHLAIQASKILKEKGYDFNWNIIGNGELHDALQTQINELNVGDVIHLLGTKENPYPYIADADIVVQCSIYEGKSIALDEAKILAKPIVCTDYNSAHDQIEDGVTGVIVPVCAEGIADGIEKIIKVPDLSFSLSENLKKISFDQGEAWQQHEDIFCLM